MSTILKALRRLEADNEDARPKRSLPEEVLARPGAPLVRRRARRAWGIVGIGTAAAALVAFFAWWMAPELPAPAPGPVAAAAGAAAPAPRGAASAPAVAQAPAPNPAAARAVAERAVGIAAAPPAPVPAGPGASSALAPVLKTAPEAAPPTRTAAAAPPSQTRPATPTRKPPVAAAPSAPATPPKIAAVPAPRPKPRTAPPPAPRAQAKVEVAPPKRTLQTATRRLAAIQAPKVHVLRTDWHPQRDRRRARVEVPGRDGWIEVREGDAVGTLVVATIEPSAVVFRQGTRELRSKVGAGR